MGDLEVLSIQPNGLMIEEDRLFSPPSPSPTPSPLSSNPSPTPTSEECWERAEQTAQKIIKQIQPTFESEVDRLIGKYHLLKQSALYKFLDYYSKFDWECYCISLHGPVSIFSLPDMVAVTPDNDGGELLLDKEFLRKCVDIFSVPSRGLDAILQSFPLEHFNIIDPFNEKNNLG